MKKLKLLLVLLILSSVSVFAQPVPNHNFEEWEKYFGINQPKGWVTSGLFFPAASQNPVVKTTEKYNGDYAIRLETVNVEEDGKETVLQGVAWTCDLFNGKGGVGFPYTKRPKTLSFFYKYAPVFQDTMIVAIGFTKYKGGYESELIGSGAFISTKSADDYVYGSINIEFETNEIPDTAYVMLMSGTDTVNAGSVLYVDYMNFDIHLDASDENEGFKIGNIYPQPAQNELIIPLHLKSTENVKLNITDITGKELYTSNESKATGKHDLNVDVSTYKPGVYIYKISSGNSTKTGKFIVAK